MWQSKLLTTKVAQAHAIAKILVASGFNCNTPSRCHSWARSTVFSMVKFTAPLDAQCTPSMRVHRRGG